MRHLKIMGIDIAKNIFQLYRATARGAVTKSRGYLF
jgi:hypothetical protein